MNNMEFYISRLETLIEESKKSYKNGITLLITTIIKKVMAEANIDVDINNESYYAEIMTEEESCNTGDEASNLWYVWAENIQHYINKCSDELFRSLYEIDEGCEIVGEVFTDNSILFEIQVDGMEFTYEFHNTYNK